MNSVRRTSAATIIFALVAGLALGHSPPNLTVAVLDFENAGAGDELNWMRAGLSLMLAADLANLEGVSVVEREQAGSLLEELRLREGGLVRSESLTAGRKGLGADFVVLGSFREQASQLTLRASVFDTSTGEETYIAPVTGGARDALALEQELFHALAGALELDLRKVRRPRQAKPLAEKLTLAVTSFLNISPVSTVMSGDALADLVTAELSKVAELRLVERGQVREILREFELSAAGLSEQTGKVVEAGKLLGARVMLLGSYATVGPDMRIDARLVRVPSGEITNVMSVQSRRDEAHKLAQRLALAVASRLQLEPDVGTRAKMEEEGTKSLEAYLYYSMAKDPDRVSLSPTTLRRYQQVAYVDPDFRNIHLWIGIAYYWAENYARAIETFEAYLPHYLEKGTATWAWFVTIPHRCYMSLGQFDKALAFEETVKEVFPDSMALSLMRAGTTSAARIQDVKRKREYAERQLAEAPGRAEEATKKLAQAQDDMECYEAKLDLADVYKTWRRTEDAMVAYVEALTSFPGSDDPLALLEFGRTCLRVAQYFQAYDKVENARPYYLLAARTLEEAGDRAKESDPGKAGWAYALAARECYGKLDDAVDMRRVWRKAAIAKATTDPRGAIIIARNRLHDEELAAQLLEAVRAGITGDSPEDYLRRAQAYRWLEMRREADAEVGRFLQKYPDHDDPVLIWRLIECTRAWRDELINSLVKLYFRLVDRKNPARLHSAGLWAARVIVEEIAWQHLSANRHKRLYVTGLIMTDELDDFHRGAGETYRKAALYLRARERGEEAELDPLLHDYRTAYENAMENLIYDFSLPTSVRPTSERTKMRKKWEGMVRGRRRAATGPESDTEEGFRSWLSQEIIPMIEGALERNRRDAALAKLLCKLYLLMGDTEMSDSYFRDALVAAPDKSEFLSNMAQFYEDERATERAKHIRLQLESEAASVQ